MSIHSYNTLVLEDNPAELRLIKLALAESKRAKFKLLPFATADHTIEYVSRPESAAVDLALLDVHTPGSTDGRDAVYALRNSSYVQRIPIVLFSDMPPHMLNGANFMADLVIPKPQDLDSYLALDTLLIPLLTAPKKSSSLATKA